MARIYLLCVLLFSLVCLSVNGQMWFLSRDGPIDRSLGSQKRLIPDFGYDSRYQAARNYANALKARMLAEDPYGPGRRKRETGA